MASASVGGPGLDIGFVVRQSLLGRKSGKYPRTAGRLRQGQRSGCHQWAIMARFATALLPAKSLRESLSRSGHLRVDDRSGLGQASAVRRHQCQ